ncbi:AraC family transcriptional regulator [Mediterraneibacter glycyrrhizinilyticus]|uniref:helix-turn-helix domain-containing protein n=1 Tax=Mediterraneibacter glycyrrhizinilyticus TaxID=342942 RepID=UPI0019609F23|nr:helix-turn-helix domain-containing protein [Mediterraneibacter glycyrrhizinilyticus]MBM6804298.1 AraC family transcriptional regulator [Mediterraneibacter glycyrrhizinilyticus]MDM8209819.1 helix-turn-helix domain-containing protein [Mediterraneibacter glycyrrhizinilyticus]
MEMDYIALCRNFYSATNIPVTLTKNDHAIYSSLHDILGTTPVYYREQFPMDEENNPCFCGDYPDIEYGRIMVEGTGYDLILGPVFSVPVTDEIIRQAVKGAAISLEQRERFIEMMYAVPRLSQTQFAQYLALLHQCINHKTVDMGKFFSEDDLNIRSRKEQQTDRMAEDQEEENTHNSYYFELELYQLVKEGNTEKLKKFLNATRPPLKEGKMAASPLRHAKNVFISVVTKAGMMGAIPGGVDVEKTYQLMDYYIQECEQLTKIERINQLQYVMLLDFCQRSGEHHIPDGISHDVYKCMTYIREHTNESISIEDAAASVNRSSSYMMKHFKNELGINMGAYIMRCKLEEAKSLLTYSEKSLAEISSYLCFSSQSYFQNVFKKQYGVTPLQYRKQTKVGSV